MAMSNYDISEQITEYKDELEEHASDGGLWHAELGNILADLDKPFESVNDWLDVAHRASMLSTIFTAGLQNNKAFRDEFESIETLQWKTLNTPPVDDALQDSLVDKLYIHNPQPGDKISITVGDYSKYVGEKLVERALKDGVTFQFGVSDTNFSRLVLKHVDEDGLDRMAAKAIEASEGLTKRISSIPIMPDYDLIDMDKDKQIAYSQKTKSISERVSSGDIFFTLTKIPSRKDAEIDGQDYDDYVKLFFEMCDQPWDHIDKAHRKLISLLNDTKELRFRNDDGTDLTMELTDSEGKDFTFANSLIAKNVPGSEVFSAPRKDSLNGTIVAKGQFNYFPGKIITNLTLHFKDGHLDSFEADDGAEHFQDFLDRHPGNRYTGEIGIGTNPHLKQHVLNSLLVEKIGGSFHVALGHPYTMTEYMGEAVYLNNGNNETPDHWDVTTMLYGKGGSIEADGEIIMENGRFVDPDLAVLNEGWAAVPVSERPEYWKDFTGYDRSTGKPSFGAPKPAP